MGVSLRSAFFVGVVLRRIVGFCRLGIVAVRIGGHGHWWVGGFVARGFVGSWVRGFVGSWAGVFVGSWVRGQGNSWVRGFVGRAFRGFVGLWARGAR